MERSHFPICGEINVNDIERTGQRSNRDERKWILIVRWKIEPTLYNALESVLACAERILSAQRMVATVVIRIHKP